MVAGISELAKGIHIAIFYIDVCNPVHVFWVVVVVLISRF